MQGPALAAAVAMMLVATAWGSALAAPASPPPPGPPGADVVCVLPACLELLVLGLAFAAVGLALEAACGAASATCSLPATAVSTALAARRCVERLIVNGPACVPVVGGLVPAPGGNASASQGRYLTTHPLGAPSCARNWYQEPDEEPVGLWGLCLLPPTEPTFTISVHDDFGQPVRFRWVAIDLRDGGCDWGSGVGTLVVTLRRSGVCDNVRVAVHPNGPALPGRIVLGPAPSGP